MTAIARQYNLDDVSLQLGGFIISELTADGMSVATDEDKIVAVQGSHGSVAVSNKFDNLAEMTISVMQTSPTNAQLTALLNTTFNVYMRDNLGQDVVKAEQARIMKRPDLEMGEEPGAREWVVKLFNPIINYGGNIPA